MGEFARTLALRMVTYAHFIALAEYNRAKDGIAFACQFASAYIDREWSTRTWQHDNSRGAELWGIGYWETYPEAARAEPVKPGETPCVRI